MTVRACYKRAHLCQLRNSIIALLKHHSLGKSQALDGLKAWVVSQYLDQTWTSPKPKYSNWSMKRKKTKSRPLCTAQYLSNKLRWAGSWKTRRTSLRFLKPSKVSPTRFTTLCYLRVCSPDTGKRLKYWFSTGSSFLMYALPCWAYSILQASFMTTQHLARSSKMLV